MIYTAYKGESHITLEQNKANSSRRARWQKIIKLKDEINKIETKKTIQRINKTKELVLPENQQNRQNFIQTNQKMGWKSPQNERIK